MPAIPSGGTHHAMPGTAAPRRAAAPQTRTRDGPRPNGAPNRENSARRRARDKAAAASAMGNAAIIAGTPPDGPVAVGAAALSMATDTAP